MKIKATYLYLLALFVTTCNSSGFDHFWLVQVWPSGYCLQANCNQSSDRFMIHGLWAVSISDETLPGTNVRDPAILPSIERLQTALKEYWLPLAKSNSNDPKGFWTYQWKKHGSAAKQFIQPLDYFERALKLAKHTDLRNTLAYHKAVPILPDGSSYNKRDYKAAIRSKTGHDPLLKCFQGDGNISHLMEVIICVDAQARRFIQCAKQKDWCYSDITFDVPPQTS